MPLTLKIAFLNILRNKRRTLITLLAIMTGCVCIIVYGGYIQSVFLGVSESLIRTHAGHIQIFQKGFNEFGKTEPENYMLSPDMVKKVIKMVEQQPEVIMATQRVNFGGLISNGNVSSGAFGVGIEADNEVDFSAGIKILEGEDIFPEDTDHVLIGQALARSLGATVGSDLTLMSGTVDGSVNAVNMVVSAIITTGRKELDKRYIKANLEHIQELLFTEGITRILVLLDKTAHTEKVCNKLKDAFEEAGLDIELKKWDEMADIYHQLVEYYDRMFLFISFVVIFIVVLGIANTMTMAVLERTKEIGTIRALGNTRGQIIKLFITESTYLGIIGGAMGLALGIVFANWVTSLMIMQSPPPGSTVSYPYTIHIVQGVLIKAFILGITASVLSSIYPAIKASRLKIVDALRHI